MQISVSGRSYVVYFNILDVSDVEGTLHFIFGLFDGKHIEYERLRCHNTNTSIDITLLCSRTNSGDVLDTCMAIGNYVEKSGGTVNICDIS